MMYCQLIEISRGTNIKLKIFELKLKILKIKANSKYEKLFFLLFFAK